MASTRPSIRVVKQFTYRGVTRFYSNRYYFSGGVPADASHWTSFSDQVANAEQNVHFPLASGGSKIVETFGYEAGSEIPVFSKTYALDGILTAGGNLVPGDVAGLIRYSTAARSSRNHPIYLFNYYHGVAAATGAGNQDTWYSGQRTAMGTYATDWDSIGFSDGVHTFKKSSAAGHDATGHVVETLLTHRDLPR